MKQPWTIPYTSLTICFVIQPCAVTSELLSSINVVRKAEAGARVVPSGLVLLLTAVLAPVFQSRGKCQASYGEKRCHPIKKKKINLKGAFGCNATVFRWPTSDLGWWDLPRMVSKGRPWPADKASLLSIIWLSDSCIHQSKAALPVL